MTVRIIEVYGHGATTRIGRDGSVNADHGVAVAVTQGQQLIEQPSGQAAHVFANIFDADGFQVAQRDLHSRDREIIDGPILERFPSA